MVHLITCVLRGCGPLGPQLAPQLQQALATLEPLEQLAQEREQSRSRSASPAPAELVQSDMWGDGDLPETVVVWNTLVICFLDKSDGWCLISSMSMSIS